MLSFLATSSVVVRGSVSMIVSVDHCQLWWLATALLIFKALVSFAKLLEPSLQSSFLSRFWTKSFVDAADCLWCTLGPMLKTNLKYPLNLHFV